MATQKEMLEILIKCQEDVSKTMLAVFASLDNLNKKIKDVDSSNKALANSAKGAGDALKNKGNAANEAGNAISALTSKIGGLVLSYITLSTAYNVVSYGFETWLSQMKLGIEAHDNYKKKIIESGALVGSTLRAQMSPEDAYKTGEEYGKWLYWSAVRAEAAIGVSSKETWATVMEFARRGYGATSDEVVEKVGLVSKVIEIATRGMMNQQFQVYQEIRNLFLESPRMVGAQLLQQLESLDPVYKKNLEAAKAMAKAQNDIGPLVDYILGTFAAFIPAAERQALTWEVLTRRINTFIDSVRIVAFGPIYEEIISYGNKLYDAFFKGGRFTDEGSNLAQAVTRMWSGISETVKTEIDKIIKNPEQLTNWVKLVAESLSTIASAVLATAKAINYLVQVYQNWVENRPSIGEKVNAFENADLFKDSTKSIQKDTEDWGKTFSSGKNTALSFIQDNIIDALSKSLSPDPMYAKIHEFFTAIYQKLESYKDQKIVIDQWVDVMLHMTPKLSKEQFEIQAKGSSEYSSLEGMSSADIAAFKTKILVDEQRRQETSFNKKLGSATSPAGKDKKGGGDPSQGISNRLDQLIDTYKQKIAKYTESEYDAIDASYNKQIDTINQIMNKRTKTHVENLTLIEKEALAKEFAEKEANAEKEKSDRNYFSWYAQESGDTIAATFNKMNEEIRKRPQDAAQIQATMIPKILETSHKLQAVFGDTMKSQIDTMAGLAPLLEDQVRLKGEALELDIKSSRVKFDDMLALSKMKDGEKDILRTKQDQLEAMRRQAQLREDWRMQGLSGGMNIAYEQSINAAKTWQADQVVSFLQSLPQTVSGNLAQGFVNALQGKKTDFEQMGWTMAEAVIQKQLEGFITQLMPMMIQAAGWLFGIDVSGAVAAANTRIQGAVQCANIEQQSAAAAAQTRASGGGGGGGWLSNIFGSFGGSPLPSAASGAVSLNPSVAGSGMSSSSGILGWLGNLFHSGGVLRAHSGLKLAQDEVPFVGLTGERVLNRKQTLDYDSGKTGNIKVTIINKGKPVEASAKQKKGGAGSDRELIIMLDEINSQLIGAGGKTSQALDRRYNQSQAVVVRG